MIAIARVSPIAVLLTGLIVLAACGDGDDPVVAEVGVVEIHASRLAQFVERLPEGMRSQQQGLEAIREYLSSIVDQELLLAEVFARGINDRIEVRRELDTRARSRLSQLYLTRKLVSSEDLSTEEVERVFRERGHDRQRLLARILVSSQAEPGPGAGFVAVARRRAPAPTTSGTRSNRWDVPRSPWGAGTVDRAADSAGYRWDRRCRCPDAVGVDRF